MSSPEPAGHPSSDRATDQPRRAARRRADTDSSPDPGVECGTDASLDLRVPDTTRARVLVWAVIAALAGLRAAPEAELPRLAPVLDVDTGTCTLSADAGGAPCPCELIPAALRRVLGLPIPLHSASPADLEHVPGIGPARARAIVAAREAAGPFVAATDLERIPGIGPKTAAAIAPYLLLTGADPACDLTDWDAALRARAHGAVSDPEMDHLLGADPAETYADSER